MPTPTDERIIDLAAKCEWRLSFHVPLEKSVTTRKPGATEDQCDRHRSKRCEAVDMQSKEHWEKVYSTKAPNEVSWFQQHATLSLRLIKEANVFAPASIIDVGGGASTLVDDLVSAGFSNVTVLDLSGAALAAAKTRLGARAAEVRWLEANVMEAQLPEFGYDVWHDRAVFHFLTSSEERRAYVRAVLHTVKPGGLVIVATFAEDGPTKCSGLPVMRYGAADLHAEFGEPFELLGHERENHHTPNGSEQKFVYCFCRRARTENA